MTEASQGNSRSPTLQEVLRAYGEYFANEIYTSLPGRVEKYFENEQKADVKPLVKRRLETSDGKEILESIPIITNVPICWPRAGDFFMHMPMKPGDFVWIMFSMLSIDKWANSDAGDDTDPDDFLRHHISGAVAVPGVYPFKEALERDDRSKTGMTMGKEGGTHIHVTKEFVSLGVIDADEFMARADRTLTSIQNFVDSHDAFVSKFNLHTHEVIAFGQGAALPITGLQQASPHGTADDVAADLVKGE